MVKTRPRETVARLERLLDEVPATDVAELHPHLRAAASHLDVLELDDLVQGAVKLDRHATLDLSGGHHSSATAGPLLLSCATRALSKRSEEAS